MRPGERNKFFHRFCGQRRMHNQHHRRGSCQRHGREIALNVVRQLAKQTHVDHMRVGAKHEGVAIRRSTRGEFRADVAARAAAIVDHNLLADLRNQLLRNDARHNIAVATCGVWHDKA